MRNFLFFILMAIFAYGCGHNKIPGSIDPMNWSKRSVDSITGHFNKYGSTYLPVYSQIYGMTEHRIHDLTVTVSMRNINVGDSIIILNAAYYNTKGELIRSYLEKPVFLQPLETVEIVIEEADREGGTGANFIFEWKVKTNSNEPFFESVMISTAGQQGLSFVTRGIRIE